ncbi:MAG: glycosyltransferase family 2 protein, partial [Patescibacteria group bacterium]
KIKIFVVNDGSTDHTASVLKRFEKNKQIQILHKENGGKHTAINLALLHTKSDLVGCLDADSFVATDALKNIVTYFENKNVMSVVPSIIVENPRNVIQFIQKVEYNWGVFLRKILSYMGALYITPGPFSIFRREIFEKLGDYKHAHHTEDLEFALRMQKNHYKIVNAHNAHVYTVAPKTLRSLYVQRLRWTYGFLKNAQDYRALFFKKEYGHLGLFVLPMATITIFTALYGVGSFVFNWSVNVFEEITKIQTVGIHLPIFEFDWFFLNTNVSFLMTLALSGLTVVLLLIGKKLAEGNVSFSKDLVYFLFLYPFIAPLWLTRAVYNVVASRKISWR